MSWAPIIANVVQVTVLLLVISLIAWPTLARSPTTRVRLWRGAILGAVLVLPFAPRLPSMAEILRSENDDRRVYISAIASRVYRTASIPPVGPDGQEISRLRPSGEGDDSFPIGHLFFWTWCAVAAALLARDWTNIRSLRQLARAGVAPRNPAIQTALQDAIRRTGAPARITARVHALVDTPLTFGIRSPVILLPEATEGWSVDELTAALTHEAIHIRNRDFAVHMIAGLVAAAYWFNPLTWHALRRLRAESELRCDEETLLSGIRPSAYAGVLLRTAGLAGRPGFASGAPSLGGRGQLEMRVRRVLHHSGKSGRPTHAAYLVPALLSLALAMTPARVPERVYRQTDRPEGEPVPSLSLPVAAAPSTTILNG